MTSITALTCFLQINSSASFADLDFAVSNSNNPTGLTAGSGPGQWTIFSQITAVQEGSSTGLPDFPKMGWNADGVFITFNQFDTSTGSFLHVQLLTISQASITADVAANTSGTLTGPPTLTPGTDLFQKDLNNFFTVQPARMHGSSAGGPEFFVTSQQSGSGQTNTAETIIDVLTETNVLSANPTFTTTDVTVNPYLQTNGVPELTGQIDDRVLSADWNGNELVAAHSVTVLGDSSDHIHWYEFNTGGATPTLTQQGDVSNPNHNLTYPSIAINNNGDIGLSYIESASSGNVITEAPSVFVTERLVNDPLDTMETPVLAQAGVLGAPTGGQRGGDYSAVVFDPSDQSFWAANEFTAGSDSTDNWGTQIVNFTAGSSTSGGTPTVSPPAVTSMNQTEVLQGAPGLNLIIQGTGFDATSQVILSNDPTPIQPTFFSNTLLAARIPAGDLAQSAALTLTIQNTSSNTTSAPVAFTVEAAAPAGTNRTLNLRVGTAFSGAVASFIDVNPADRITPLPFAATINWGDGTASPGTIIKSGSLPGQFTILGAHTYSQTGTAMPVTITLTNGSATVLTVTSIANVSGAPAAGQNEAREGSPAFNLLVVGSGFDSTSAVVLGGFIVPTALISDTELVAAVSGAFLTEDGNLPVTLTGDGALTGPTTLTVTESMPNTTTRAFTFNEGVPFGTIVATFSDPNFRNDSGDYSATIDWGDGTVQNASLGATATPGLFTVVGSHTYLEPAGAVPVTVTILDDGVTAQQVTDLATVKDRPLKAVARALTAPLDGTQFNQVVASFTDPGGNGNPAQYLATIQWGDGTSSPGTIVPSGAGFAVVGTHTFTNTIPTIFRSAVTIQDVGGASATALGSIRTGGGNFSVGTNTGNASRVMVVDANNATQWITLQPYESSFKGSIRVATGLLGAAPIVVTAPGPGHSPLIDIFDRSSGRLVASFLPVPAPREDISHPLSELSFKSFTGGIYVALGDLNGDGVPDLIVAEDAGGTDEVEVFDGRFLTSTLALLGQPFQAFGGQYNAGVRVAVSGGDLVVANGPGAPPQVGIYTFNGTSFAEQKTFNPFAGTPLANFKGGAYLASGDVNGDGTPDIIVSAGPGAPSRVVVFDGTKLFLGTTTQPTTLLSFSPYGSYTGGVTVTTFTPVGSNQALIWTSPGKGASAPTMVEWSFVTNGKPPKKVETFVLSSAFDNGGLLG
jgi:hypothetical protein